MLRHKYKYFYFLHRGAMVPVSPPSLLSTSVCARMVPQTSMQKASTDRAKPRYRRFGKLAESLVPTQRGPCARSTARGERAACSSVAPPSVMFAKRTREDGTPPGVGETAQPAVLCGWLQSSPRGAPFSLSHVGSYSVARHSDAARRHTQRHTLRDAAQS